MGIRGSLSNDDDLNKNLLIAGLKVTVKQKSSTKVHAEEKILVYLEHQRQTRRMINTVGVSKLCCPGCYHLRIKENSRIFVHGQHQKWYPWPFWCSPSQDFPTLEQLLTTRKKILVDSLEDWREHRRRKRKSITPRFAFRPVHQVFHHFASWANETLTVKKGSQEK